MLVVYTQTTVISSTGDNCPIFSAVPEKSWWNTQTQYIITQSNLFLYRMSQEEFARLREGVPYVKVYRYNPKHLYPKLNGYGDNGLRSLKL